MILEVSDSKTEYHQRRVLWKIFKVQLIGGLESDIGWQLLTICFYLKALIFESTVRKCVNICSLNQSIVRSRPWLRVSEKLDHISRSHFGFHRSRQILLSVRRGSIRRLASNNVDRKRFQRLIWCSVWSIFEGHCAWICTYYCQDYPFHLEQLTKSRLHLQTLSRAKCVAIVFISDLRHESAF